MANLLRLADRIRTILFTTIGLRTLGAMTLLIDDDNQVLLIRQNYGNGRWTLPGGGVKHRESFREAALREAREEAGVHVRPDSDIRLLGLFHRRVGRWVNHIAVYAVKGWDLRPSNSFEIAEVRAFPIDALPEGVVPSVRRRIAEWQNDAPISENW